MDHTNRIMARFPREFQADSVGLGTLLKAIEDLLKKAGQCLTNLSRALERVIEYMPNIAGAWLPGSLFGVTVGFLAGMQLSQSWLLIIAFAAGCGIIGGGIIWWMDAGQISIVDTLKMAYRDFLDKKSDGIVGATMLGGAAGGIWMLATTGPVGWGIGVGAATGYGLYRSVRAMCRTD